jgi:hypothetical protein
LVFAATEQGMLAGKGLELADTGVCCFFVEQMEQSPIFETWQGIAAFHIRGFLWNASGTAGCPVQLSTDQGGAAL